MARRRGKSRRRSGGGGIGGFIGRYINKRTLITGVVLTLVAFMVPKAKDFFQSTADKIKSLKKG